jgi:hypothetical protein
MVGTLMVNRISDRVTVFVSHDYLIISIYGHAPVVWPIENIDELYHMLKRQQIERKLKLS